MNAPPLTNPSQSVIALRDVFGWVESRNNPAAIRFEPLTWAHNNFQSLYGFVIEANVCSSETARMILSASWGEFQIMGFNLYSRNLCNYTLPIARYLTNQNDQASTFDSFMQKRGIVCEPSQLYDPALRIKIARMYNGPGDPAGYSFKLLSALHALGVPQS